MKEKEQIDEDFGSMIRISVLAALLSIPNILDAATIEDILHHSTSPYKELNVYLKSNYQNVYRGYNIINAHNIIARTLFRETEGESDKGTKLVADVIWNRAGGDPQFLPDVCLKKGQFSCWNGLTTKFENVSPENFNFVIPPEVNLGKNKEQVKKWDYCKSLAAKMLLKKYTPDNPRINTYYNPNKANPDWKKRFLNGKIKPFSVGSHLFGFLPEYDGKKVDLKSFYSRTEKINDINKIDRTKLIKYKVVSGDSFSKIASKHNITISALRKLNKMSKSDINKLRVGQIIIVPKIEQ